jgi:3-hydroxybutyryl-CoA dehydrogenase
MGVLGILRPVTIVGAGTLGRRIAAVNAAGGADVHAHDMSGEQLDGCRQFVSDNIDRVQALLDVHPSQGAGDSLYGELREAVRGAWMVVETVLEDLELKRQVVGELDRLSDAMRSWRATRRHCPRVRCFRMSNTGGGC